MSLHTCSLPASLSAPARLSTAPPITAGADTSSPPLPAPGLRWVRDPRRAARRVWWTVAIAADLALAPLAFGGRAADAALLTVLLAVLARHDGVVSILGRLTTVRPGYRRHQLVYHLGQLHRAMALSALGWLLVAAVQLCVRYEHPWSAVVYLVMAGALAMMAWTARDAVRGRRHERFESVHRYVGWAVLFVLVVVTGNTVASAWASGSAADAVVPAVLLTMVVAVVAHPWSGARRLPVEVLDVTPQLVVLALPGRRRVGEFLRVSLDGHEWHSFAVSTCGTEGTGRCCLVIRRAGDWTDRLARRCAGAHPPSTLLVRTQRGFGFMGHAQSYARVLVVATGAGIGPVLLYLLDRRQSGLRCVWIARDHRAAAGVALVDRVLAGGQTTLVDTSSGRPEPSALVAAAAGSVDAVFVVGNAGVRDQIAAACAQRGLRWYGPTFDS